MKQLDIVKKWLTKANLALQESGADVLVTYDPEEANSYLNNNRLVCLVEPQRATYEIWAATEFTLRFIVISPLLSALDAWDGLEDLGEALRQPLEVETAELTFWQPENGDTYPCLLLTTTTTEMD